jgi:hypothetical protein
LKANDVPGECGKMFHKNLVIWFEAEGPAISPFSTENQDRKTSCKTYEHRAFSFFKIRSIFGLEKQNKLQSETNHGPPVIHESSCALSVVRTFDRFIALCVQRRGGRADRDGQGHGGSGH